MQRLFFDRFITDFTQLQLKPGRPHNVATCLSLINMEGNSPAVNSYLATNQRRLIKLDMER